MTFEIVLFAYARKDTQEACLWYEAQRADLGEAFYAELLNCLNKLSIAPENYGYAYKDFRRVLLKKFPYQVIYRITADTVLVYAVLHKNRSKKALAKRLK